MTSRWARTVSRRLAMSLCELDRAIAMRPELRGAVAIVGDLALGTEGRGDQIVRMARRYGFETVDSDEGEAAGRLQRLGENMLMLLLVLAANPAAARLSVLRRGRRRVYLSREGLRRCRERFASEPGGRTMTSAGDLASAAAVLAACSGRRRLPLSGRHQPARPALPASRARAEGGARSGQPPRSALRRGARPCRTPVPPAQSRASRPPSRSSAACANRATPRAPAWTGRTPGKGDGRSRRRSMASCMGATSRSRILINMFGRARHDVIVMIDSDMEVCPDYLRSASPAGSQDRASAPSPAFIAASEKALPRGSRLRRSTCTFSRT